MPVRPAKATRLRIVVPRPPVGVNQAYARNPHGGVKGFYMTSAGKAYKDAVRSYAFAAAKKAGWPKPAAVTACSIEITTWNTRHDVGAAEKLTCDSLEGIVYANDRVIKHLTMRKERDDGPPRVEIVVERAA